MRKYVDVSVYLLKHSRPMLGTRVSTTNEIMMDASVSEESLSSLGKGCSQFRKLSFFLLGPKILGKKGFHQLKIRTIAQAIWLQTNIKVTPRNEILAQAGHQASLAFLRRSRRLSSNGIFLKHGSR